MPVIFLVCAAVIAGIIGTIALTIWNYPVKKHAGMREYDPTGVNTYVKENT